MTSQLIKRYQMPGQTSEKNILKTQETLRLSLISKMKLEGFAPYLDIDPVWTWRWAGDDLYDFMLTMQAVYVGKDRAWEIDGIYGNGKVVPSTQKNK